MPHFNMWAPRTGIWGNQLETGRNFRHAKEALHWVAERQAERAGEIGSGIGSAIGMAAVGANQVYQRWKYPSAKIQLKKSSKSFTRTATRTRTKTRTKTKTKRRRKSSKSSKSSKCRQLICCEKKILRPCMAKRRKVARKSYRRKYKRRFRPKIGISNHRIVKLKSTAYYSVDPGAGSLAGGTVKLNSAFDPTGTFGSGQPLYFDQYSTMYNRYVVLGYSISVVAINATSGLPMVVGFTPMVDSTLLTDWKHYREIKGTIQKYLTNDVDRTWFKVKGSIKKFMEPAGGSLLSDDTVQAAVTADPTRMCYGHIYLQTMDNTSDLPSTQLAITITQIVKFFSPVIPSRS